MKIAIIGYKNHALRLKNLLEFLGYNNIINYNHRTDSESSIEKSDLFFIASPNDTHYYWINKLAGYNKYIFCEKPPVVSQKDLIKIKNFNKTLYFNFNYRFSYLAKVIKEYKKSKVLGNPIYINCISSHGLAFKKSSNKNWRFNNEDFFSSIVGNLGIHYIDLISFLFGKIKDLSIQNYNVVSKKLPDTCKITLSLKNCFADIFLSYAAPFKNDINIIYENGIVYLRDGSISIGKPRDTFDEKGFFKSPKTEIVKQFKNSRDYYDNSLLESIKYFLYCAKNNLGISKNHYNQSIQSNKLLLGIQ